MTPIPRPAISLITARARLAPEARTLREELRRLELQIDEGFDAGIDLIQIREPDVDAGRLAAFVHRVAARAGSSRVLVNDRIDVAAIAGAGGVHLRADSIAAIQARTFNHAWTIGRSVHAGDDFALAAEAADYLLFGTVYPTESKQSARGTGVAALRHAVQAAPVPVLAIGGMTPERAGECARAGAAGIAAIGLFLPEARAAGAMGVRRAVAALRAALADAGLAPPT